jgi:DNA polymerase I-like protein with 3'-5' exonuclease and polymerase domains/uracil-DNA glycosylase
VFKVADRFRPSVSTGRSDYDLSLPKDSRWEERSQRILLILETIDGQDLAEGRLLHERSGAVVSNLINHTLIRAKQEFGFNTKDLAFTVINFNSYKFFDRPTEEWPGHRKRMAARVHEIIAELKPTDIICFGDYAMKALMPREEHLPKKRGWVFQYDHGGYQCNITGSLDLQPLYSTKKEQADADEMEEEGDVFGKANLLFYASRNVLNAFARKNLYDLSNIRPKARYVDTIEKFDRMMEVLRTAEVAAVDTETKNGTINHNAIHTIQFAISEKSGYFLPVDHPQTPFSPKELRYIRAELRDFFYAKPGELPLKYIITQYGMFDLRILRVCLGIPIIFHPVWEITAGEYLLDENLKYLGGAPFNTSHGGLEQIFMYYGNDFYKTAPFGKGDRANPTLTRLDNPDFVLYGVMDVQSIFAIHKKQLERAERVPLGDQSYTRHFRRLVTKQMSNTVHVLSHMKQRGSTIDRDYLRMLKGQTSPLVDLIAKARQAFQKFSEVQDANKRLLKESSGQSSNKGLFNKIQTIFNPNKADHKATLFFEVMGLKPVSYSKKTKRPKIDKFFIKAYEGTSEVVKKFGEYQKLNKLYSTYVKGWWKVLSKNMDSLKTFKLYPDYGFFAVVTGRLNSSRPSLQQVPQRGDAAKYIKRMFIAVSGQLLLKFDYSAHEIRCWSYVSGDKILADLFRIGQELRQKFRMDPTEDKEKELKTKGDIHIINAYHFFNKWIDKTDPLRDAIKQIVFGVIYGKGVKTLAKDIKQAEELAQEIMNKLFARFPRASRWLKWSMNHAMENLYTYSPIGMRRNLFGVMTEINAIVAAMRRRAANSPIQGFASQIGVTAARLIELELYTVLHKFGYIDDETTDMPAGITKAVHDALHSETPYEVLLIMIHVVQWTATYGVTEYYEREFGTKFLIEPEIEMEIGAHEAQMYKWNWTDANLEEIIKKSLQDQKEIGQCPAPKRAYRKIRSAYENPELKSYLERKYPILGIHGRVKTKKKKEAS